MTTNVSNGAGSAPGAPAGANVVHYLIPVRRTMCGQDTPALPQGHRATSNRATVTCPQCQADLDRRDAERRSKEARRRAKADLRSEIVDLDTDGAGLATIDPNALRSEDIFAARLLACRELKPTCREVLRQLHLRTPQQEMSLEELVRATGLTLPQVRGCLPNLQGLDLIRVCYPSAGGVVVSALPLD